jgi:polysaccharide deacetylase family sporulation protein PdaB
VVFIVLLAAAVIYTQVIASDSAPVLNEPGKVMPVCSVETDESAVAITIDTAFGDDYTDEILKVLNEKKVKATFFIMGLWAEKNPAKADAIAQAGHEIANHSMQHTRYTDMMPQQIKEDVAKAREVIKQATGKDSVIVRMPYGAFDDESIKALQDEGYIPVKWSLDSKDWKQTGKDALKNNVINNIKKGSIIIFQNNIMDTSLALGEIIDEIKAKNYKIITLSELMIPENYTVDEAGVQKGFYD